MQSNVNEIIGNRGNTLGHSDVDAKWLRYHTYKIEKGKGVAYLLMSLMVLSTLLANSLFPSFLLLMVFNTANGVLIWYVVWRAGFRGVRFEDYEEFGKHSNQRFILLRLPLYVLEGILLNTTWLAYIVLSGMGIFPYASVVPLVFVFELVIFPLMLSLKREELVLELGIADWAFIFSFAAAALSVLVNGVGVIGFVAVIPIWIGAGLKSLYDAPNRLSAITEDSGNEVGYSTRDAVHRLASMGTLSNSSRAGILMILQREKVSTFSDLLNITGMAKSSLSSSLDKLQRAGLISSRVVISPSDRPRTIFEATDAGEKAMNEYTAFMRGL